MYVPKCRLFREFEWSRNRRAAGKVPGFLRRTESCLHPRWFMFYLRFASCSSCIASPLRSLPITFHFLSGMRLPLSFSSFLSQRWPKGHPSRVTKFWLTQTTHNLAWVVLPGARHAGKGLHHRVQSVCLRESVCVRWKSSSRSSVNHQKPVDWISGWAGSETPSLPDKQYRNIKYNIGFADFIHFFLH